MLTGEDAKSEKAPTAGIDFKYAIKKIDSKKVILNYLEIAGGRQLADLLSTTLNSNKLLETSFILTIDMSMPDTAVHHLDFWLRTIRETVNKAMEELESKSPIEASKVREQSSFKWEGHTDARRVSPIGIPVIIVGTKYDVFGLIESEQKKWM